MTEEIFAGEGRVSPAGGQRVEREPTVDYFTLCLIISLEMVSATYCLGLVSLLCQCLGSHRIIIFISVRLITISDRDC